MRFDLEDKKKISLLCDLLKAFMSGKSNVLFVWHRNEGWAILQNQEYLDNLDCSNMVNLCNVKSHFFSHMAPESREFLCFELDLTNYVRVLKSIKKQIKRMVWHIFDIDETENKAKLQLNLMVDEGQMEVQKDIFLQMRMNPQFYFKIFRDFIEDKTQYLEIKQVYMKQMKDLKKNECVYFKFYNDYVSAYNVEEENNISIKKTALEKYDYNSLISNLGGKNRLTIPPNFLVPQIIMGIKLKDPIQLFISNDIVDDHISVSLRTKNESFTFISQFISIMERDEEDYQQNPFDFQKLQSNQLNQKQAINNTLEGPYGMNMNNNYNQQQYNNSRAVPIQQDSQQGDSNVYNNNFNRNNKVQQQQSENEFQNPLNSYGSVQSHIHGLTNQMHLIDNYQVQTPQMETEIPNRKQQNNNYRKDDDYQQQQFKKPQNQQEKAQANNKKKFNINQEQEYVEMQSFNNNMNNSFAQSNQIHSVTSTQQSNANNNYNNFGGGNDSSILAKRRNDQVNQTADFSNVPFFRENATKRIKESNFTETHILPGNYSESDNIGRNQQKMNIIQQNTNFTKNKFINPLVSQDKAENSFSSFMNQNSKDNEFSIFKSNQNAVGAQIQPQKVDNTQKGQLFTGNNQNTKSKTKFNKNLF